MSYLRLPLPLRLPSSLRIAAPALVALALAVLTALPAAAQPDYHLGVRAGLAELSGSGVYDDLDSGVNPIGIQGEMRWPAFSLRLAYEQADQDGRLRPGDTLPGNTVDADLELDLQFFHVTAAYNAESPSGFSWFAGGGPSYAQADASAEGEIRFGSGTIRFRDEFDGDSLGFHVVGGVRYPVGERFELGGELMYMNLIELLDLGLATSDSSDDIDGFSGMVSFTYGF